MRDCASSMSSPLLSSHLVIPFRYPVVSAQMVQRRKRFFVDALLADGTAVTAHTCNTGAMRGMLHTGGAVLLSQRESTRAYPLELEAVRAGVGASVPWIGANPIESNRFARACIERGLVAGLAGAVRSEVARGKSRFDLCVDDGVRATLVEVKTVTLRDDAAAGPCAVFPDSPSERGARHLDALARFAKRGSACAMLYIVVRADCARMGPARAIDPVYARAFDRAQRAGVAMHAIVCSVDERGHSFGGALPVDGAQPLRGAA